MVYPSPTPPAGHSVTVNGVEAITLGHGMQGEVVGHPFLGNLTKVTKRALATVIITIYGNMSQRKCVCVTHHAIATKG
jgi:hypothetical protein